MWPCPGCGRQLISAVHLNPPIGMYCAPACKKQAGAAPVAADLTRDLLHEINERYL